MTKLFIHQPEYFPWVNFFIKAALSDKFVILDDVQYMRRGFQNRNKIKTSHGSNWITVPIKYTKRNTLIKDVMIDNSKNWQEDHKKKIINSYKKTLFYSEVMKALSPIFESKWSNLCDLNYFIINLIFNKLNINCEPIKASSIKSNKKKNDLILDICDKLGAKKYITGEGSKSYLKEDLFTYKNIKIDYIKKKDLKYSQPFMSNNGFIPDLSIIDYLFSNGFQSFKKMI